jgi:hypothetical protein
MNYILYSCNDSVKKTFHLLCEIISNNVSNLRFSFDNFNQTSFELFKNTFDKYQLLYSYYQTISCNQLNIILTYSYLFSVLLFLVSIIIVRKTYNDIKHNEKDYLKLQIEHKKLTSKFNKLKIALHNIDFIAKNKDERSSKRLSYISSEILSISREINKKC